MNNNYNNQIMDAQQYFELVEVPVAEETQYYDETYTPSEVSDADYIMTESYAPPAKMARKAPAPTPIESRPGRAPKISDDKLSATELERRNRRRARNREAAARQRNRRIAKVDQLESQVQELTDKNTNLTSENERLRAELDQLRFKLKVQPPRVPVKKATKRPAPVDIPNPLCDIPDQLFTPGGNYVLQTPAELKQDNFFPMETTETEQNMIIKEKEAMRQNSISDFLQIL